MKRRFIFCILLCASLLEAADYEILEKSDSLVVESASFAREHHLLVIRILTEDGIDYREVLPVNTYIQIKNVTGSIQFPDQRSRNLKKEDIAELPLSPSAELLTDYKGIVIAPSDLQRGSVVRIEYDRTITNLLYMDPWVYATSVPVHKASCSVTYPSAVPLKYRTEGSDVKIEKSEANGNTTIRFQSSDQKEISMYGKSESFGLVEKRVVFLPEQCLTDRWMLSTKSWQDVAGWFSELSKFAYHEDPGMDQVVNETVRRYQQPRDIAETLYQYIQKNYAYAAIEIGIGGYKPRFASETFRKKYGDCKDLTMLYLTLLKKAGIEGYPALVDTHSGKFFYSDFPSPTQFNHCIAFLPGIGNGTWVDSTVKNFHLGEIPSVIQGKYALISGGPNMLRKIPEDLISSNVLKMQFSGVLNGTQLQMTGRVETLGQAAMLVNSMQNALTKNSMKFYVYDNLLVSGMPVQKLQTALEGERTLRLSFATPVTEIQPYLLLLVNAIHYPPLDQLALDSQSNQFFALGNPVRMIFQAEVDLAGHRLVNEPLKKGAQGDYVTYNLELKEENGKLVYLIDVFFANGFLNDGEMQKYQEEMRRFSGLIQRTVVIR